MTEMDSFHYLQQTTHQHIKELGQQRAQINLAALASEQGENAAHFMSMRSLRAIVLWIFHALRTARQTIIRIQSIAAPSGSISTTAAENQRRLSDTTQAR
jgi:hypothetical protein